MLENFILIHREGPQPEETDSDYQGQAYPWRTCLRQVFIGFAPEFIPSSSEKGVVFKGSDAYRFFLEVICGLHSKVLGETEVYGQFKKILESKPDISNKFMFSKIMQSFVEESKLVRNVHLKNLGSQSYGSLVRRRLEPHENLVFLGGGQLVQKMLPWLHDESRTVSLFVREPEKVKSIKNNFSKVNVFQLSEKFPEKSNTVVIAVPLTSNEIQKWLDSHSSIKQVIDLRETSHTDRLQISHPLVTLNDVFNELQETQTELKNKVSEAKAYIFALTEKRASRVEVRPFGWEDLCG